MIIQKENVNTFTSRNENEEVANLVGILNSNFGYIKGKDITIVENILEINLEEIEVIKVRYNIFNGFTLDLIGGEIEEEQEDYFISFLNKNVDIIKGNIKIDIDFDIPTKEINMDELNALIKNMKPLIDANVFNPIGLDLLENIEGNIKVKLSERQDSIVIYYNGYREFDECRNFIDEEVENKLTLVSIELPTSYNNREDFMISNIRYSNYNSVGNVIKSSLN